MKYWRPVVGYENRYEVSDSGDVCSLLKGRLLTHSKQSGGYKQVTLHSDDGKQRSRYVHDLVLTAFAGPRPDGMQACHNNGDKSDNRLLNLRWDTPKANCADKVTHGSELFGEKRWSAKLTDAQVAEIISSSERGRHIAKRLGISESRVSVIRKQGGWHKVGNRWQVKREVIT